ncbi:MAG: hypothetical protein LUD72_00955 [Bacteroidales bacterium]|nr:hypothetical protein [Bacteroidales bacterium]
MKRIDLNMSVIAFCADYVHHPVQKRIENILHGNARLESVRDVCEMQEEDLFKFRAWGRKSNIALKEALNECGLHLGMSDEELADYERYWLEEKARDIHSNTTDWEQRRWELAMRIFAHDVTFPYAINEADKFIEKYKQTLNMEE